MNKLDFNIEISHIYADEEFGNEQIQSIKIFRQIANRLKKDGKTFVTSILIDDFNPTTFTLDEHDMLNKIKELGINIDFIGYEAKFVPVADKIIKLIPSNKLKLEYFSKNQRDVLLLKSPLEKIGLKENSENIQRHTCAILSAAWTLCRLGAFKNPKDAIKNLNKRNFEAKRVITILPKKYKDGENKVLEIIRSTKLKNLIDRMEYEFYETNK